LISNPKVGIKERKASNKIEWLQTIKENLSEKTKGLEIDQDRNSETTEDRG